MNSLQMNNFTILYDETIWNETLAKSKKKRLKFLNLCLIILFLVVLHIVTKLLRQSTVKFVNNLIFLGLISIVILIAYLFVLYKLYCFVYKEYLYLYDFFAFIKEYELEAGWYNGELLFRYKTGNIIRQITLSDLEKKLGLDKGIELIVDDNEHYEKIAATLDLLNYPKVSLLVSNGG